MRSTLSPMIRPRTLTITSFSRRVSASPPTGTPKRLRRSMTGMTTPRSWMTPSTIDGACGTSRTGYGRDWMTSLIRMMSMPYRPEPT